MANYDYDLKLSEPEAKLLFKVATRELKGENAARYVHDESYEGLIHKLLMLAADVFNGRGQKT